MDRADHTEDERPETANNVPALLHDYRAQREAWREQARNLARMREEVLAAADREAQDIVSVARAEVRRILLKARRDLLVLAAQVRAAGRLGDGEDGPDVVAFLPNEDFGNASEALTTARQDVRRVLDESRPELEGLAAEGEALRAALRQHRPSANGGGRVIEHVPAPTVEEAPVERYSQVPDFEFTSIGQDSPDFGRRFRIRRAARAFVAATLVLGAVAVAATGWWLTRDRPATKAATPSQPSAGGDRASTADSERAPAVTASEAATARTRTDVSGSPLTVNVAAKRTAWIRVTADGRILAERLFNAGETQLVRATKEVSIRAGDAGAVFVSVDGRQAVALGGEGQVVTRRYEAAPRTQPTAPLPAAPRPTPAAPIAGADPVRPPVASATPPSPVVPAPLPQRVPEPQPQTVVRDTPPALPAPAVPAPAATAGARPAGASTPDRPAATPPASTATAPSLRELLTSAAARWLDAYYRQDRASMVAISGAAVNVADDRTEAERLPRGLAGVRRSLDDVNLQVFGSEAMLTAKMTERMEDVSAGKMSQATSFVSHMWSQRNGTWQLHDVRIVSASALTRAR